MNIPRYWIKESRSVPGVGGRTCEITAWGWSSESPGEATRVANARLDRMAVWHMKGTFPAKYEYMSAMNHLNCDPLYAILTRRQACFRARLSPKPWRIGLPNPPFDFPRETPGRLEAFQTWLSQYDSASQSRAACMLWKQVGPDPTDPRIRAVMELHDHLAARANRLEDLA